MRRATLPTAKDSSGKTDFDQVASTVRWFSRKSLLDSIPGFHNQLELAAEYMSLET